METIRKIKNSSSVRDSLFLKQERDTCMIQLDQVTNDQKDSYSDKYGWEKDSDLKDYFKRDPWIMSYKEANSLHYLCFQWQYYLPFPFFIKLFCIQLNTYSILPTVNDMTCEKKKKHKLFYPHDYFYCDQSNTILMMTWFNLVIGNKGASFSKNEPTIVFWLWK